MLNKICILYKNYLRLTLLVAGGQARKTHVYWFKKPPLAMKEYQSFEGQWVEGCIDEPVIMLDDPEYGGKKIDLAPYISHDEVLYQVIGVTKSGKMSWRDVSEKGYSDFMKRLDHFL